MTFLLLTRVILKAILACRVFFHESFEWCKGKEKLSSFDWSMDSPDPYHECSRLDECRRYVCLQWSCPLCPSTCLNWWLWAQSTLLENLSFPHCHHRGVKCRRTAQVCALCFSGESRPTVCPFPSLEKSCFVFRTRGDCVKEEETY